MELIVVVGPNGSGKSTVIHTENLDSSEYTYLSADSICKTLKDEIIDEAARNAAAWKECEEIRNNLINSGESFVWETVFSDERRLDVLRQARARGYSIKLIFVTTVSVEINVKRVKQRVKMGGHNVPEDKIRSRYERTMCLLPQIIPLCNWGRIYDNSIDYDIPQEAILAIVFGKETITILKDAPKWARETFEEVKRTKGSEYIYIREKRRNARQEQPSYQLFEKEDQDDED